MLVVEQIAYLERPTAIMTVALPGSESEAVVNQIVGRFWREGPIQVINPDEIGGELLSKKSEVIRERCLKRVEAMLGMGGIAIIHANHLDKTRLQIVDSCKALGAKTVAALVVEMPIEIAKLKVASMQIPAGLARPTTEQIDAMEEFRQANFITTDNPGEFDIVLTQPYTELSQA